MKVNFAGVNLQGDNCIKLGIKTCLMGACYRLVDIASDSILSPSQSCEFSFDFSLLKRLRLLYQKEYKTIWIIEQTNTAFLQFYFLNLFAHSISCTPIILAFNREMSAFFIL